MSQFGDIFLAKAFYTDARKYKGKSTKLFALKYLKSGATALSEAG